MSPAEFREARLTLGLSVAQMAAQLGVSRTHVRRMEIERPDARASRSVTARTERQVRQWLAGYRPPGWPAAAEEQDV